jgi:hypothetical protein
MDTVKRFGGFLSLMEETGNAGISPSGRTSMPKSGIVG